MKHSIVTRSLKEKSFYTSLDNLQQLFLRFSSLFFTILSIKKTNENRSVRFSSLLTFDAENDVRSIFAKLSVHIGNGGAGDDGARGGPRGNDCEARRRHPVRGHLEAPPLLRSRPAPFQLGRRLCQTRSVGYIRLKKFRFVFFTYKKSLKKISHILLILKMNKIK